MSASQQTINDRYEWLISRFRCNDVTMDGNASFRFDHSRLPRARTVTEMVDKGIQQDIDDLAEFERKE